MTDKEKAAVIKSIVNHAFRAQPPEEVVAEHLFRQGITEDDFNKLSEKLCFEDTVRIPIANSMRGIRNAGGV